MGKTRIKGLGIEVITRLDVWGNCIDVKKMKIGKSRKRSLIESFLRHKYIQFH